MDKVKMWTKVGPGVILAEGNHGKKLVDQTFLTKHGETVNYTIVDGNCISIIVFPLTTDMEVIAVKQFRPAANEIILELPGGNNEPEDKDFTQTAQRELIEETGYRSDELIALPNKLWPDPSSLTMYFYSFLAQECKQTQRSNNLDSNEDTETLLVPLSAWMDMISYGKITDMKTIAVTLLATLALNGGRQ